MSFIPVAEYRPDVAHLNSLYTDMICNVIPAHGSYIPMPSFQPFSQFLPEKPLTVFSTKTIKGKIAIFAATTTKIYILDDHDLSWRDVSQKNILYSAKTDSPWSFAVFGSYILAVNKHDKPQIFELGKSERFRDLGGNPPRAAIVKIWGDFICLMGLADHPARVFWSGLNDVECWTAGQKKCDYQDFPDGGSVQGSNESSNPLIFLQSAIYRGMFIPGSDFIFSFQKIHDKCGAKTPLSIASRGAYSFYADEGGFFQISDQGHLTPIGFEKLDRTIFSNSRLSGIIGVIDPFHTRVYWALDHSGTHHFDQMLIYDWSLQLWSMAKLEAVTLMPLYTTGHNLANLDQISNTLESLSFPLDSQAWQMGIPVLGIISLDHQLGLFCGSPEEAIITTPELGQTNGKIQRITSLYPAIDTTNAFISIGSRFKRSEKNKIQWGKEKQASRNTGRYLARSRARFHKIQLRIPAETNWNHMSGFDISWNEAGHR